MQFTLEGQTVVMEVADLELHGAHCFEKSRHIIGEKMDCHVHGVEYTPHANDPSGENKQSIQKSEPWSHLLHNWHKNKQRRIANKTRQEIGIAIDKLNAATVRFSANCECILKLILPFYLREFPTKVYARLVQNAFGNYRAMHPIMFFSVRPIMFLFPP